MTFRRHRLPARLTAAELATKSDDRVVLVLVQQADRLLEGVAAEGVAGLEGFVDDGLPVIGPGTGEPGIYHAFGFSTHGFQLGPAVGRRIVADLVTQGQSNLPIAPFRIDRFAAAVKAS
ncbi:MAG: FAD-dependent oxidoreductase [Rhodospirillales bacterium]|nr:FAD-dependent oxidoreductase [Rhodospirillales bacterium]MDH3969899.1 FAD-dependent oxidoreductase [Rhodospirillales bacterium]